MWIAFMKRNWILCMYNQILIDIFFHVGHNFYICKVLKIFISLRVNHTKIFSVSTAEKTKLEKRGKTFQRSQTERKAKNLKSKSQSTFYVCWSACDPLKILIFHVRFFISFKRQLTKTKNCKNVSSFVNFLCWKKKRTDSTAFGFLLRAGFCREIWLVVKFMTLWVGKKRNFVGKQNNFL